MIVVDGEETTIRSAAVSVRAAGYMSIEPWVFLIWRQLLVGGRYGEPIPWISPGVVALVLTRVFSRSPGISGGEPHAFLDAWVSRLARAPISRVVFSRFDWSDLPGSTDRFLSILLSRSSVHLEAIDAVIWTNPPDTELLYRHVNAELERNDQLDPRNDPAFSALIEALAIDLLHHSALNPGIEARLSYPDIVDDVDMEHIAAVWHETVEKTLHRLGPVYETQPIAVDAVFVKDEFAVANGYRDIEPRAPGAWDALLPSELGLMEDTGEIDLFDIKAAENELLHFVADNESEKRVKRDLLLFSEIPLQYRDLFLRFDVAAWYMAWWELAVRVLAERMAGDQLEFTLVVAGLQPKRWRKMSQLLVARVKAVMPEASLTICEESLNEDIVNTNIGQTWWIAPDDSPPTAPHVIHCPSDGPRLEYLSATIHTSSVIHRYTNQLVELLEVMEKGGKT